MDESIDVLQVHDFIRNLLDHVIYSNEKVLNSLGIAAELTSERDHAQVVHVERCGNQLWESKLLEDA